MARHPKQIPDLAARPRAGSAVSQQGLSRSAVRDAELQAVQQQINALLVEFDADLAVQQLMQTDAQGHPRYSFTVNVVAKG